MAWPDIRIELRPGATTMSVTWLGRRLAHRAASGVVEVTRIEVVWLAVDPVDVRAGPDTLRARVVEVFGAAKSHHGYLFANARWARLKLLMLNGFGLWCAVRRVNQGRFVWPSGDAPAALTRAQFNAPVLGLPWRRQEQISVITRV